MPTTFNPITDTPEEVENAAQSGELVVFIGAGISQLIGCPSWDGFAEKILSQLVPNAINYYDLSQINSISDPKKRLSIALIIAQEKGVNIDYKAIFDIKLPPNNVYSHLNKFNCAFITTNYDKFIFPLSRNGEPENNWRFYQKKDLLRDKLDVNGNVVHLHGCIDDPNGMIITTRDYLEH
jgi:NAD-dependent SIR2 family protein deacetylase